ncbi:hypothetical protein HF086_006507 [Spodoptera exigua]|uniref:Peptidase S1 domain-containing protein n=1 Tax=Spodoptera exigua TaxID=7107 RepID=A0A922SHA2_SPOEX|nr:hypothetical protein HF086_006507 [Spodoptera exigua]
MLASHNSLRIIYGEEIKEEEFPYVVGLNLMTMFHKKNISVRLCTGSMLKENWGITAGHCMPRSFVRKNFTTAIWHSSIPPSQSLKTPVVVQWHVHPSYRVYDTARLPDLIVDNDISLFRSEPEIKLTRYARLSALDRGSLQGLPIIYIGGGRNNTKKSRSFRNEPLRKGYGVVIACNELMNTKSKHILCISPKCEDYSQRPWFGDSGGPLIYDDQLVGVCSFGTHEGRVSQNAFVAISSYINWISDIMQVK